MGVSFNVALYVSIVVLDSVLASSLQELQQKYMEIVMDCIKESPITQQDLEILKNKQMPDSRSAKCLFACTYRRAGMLDNQGMLSVDGVNAITERFLSDDPSKMQRAKDFAEACKSVNDAVVFDGADGCDRAGLIFKCSVEKAPEFDLAI